MQSILMATTALLATAYASAIPNGAPLEARAGKCIGTFTGVNSEGGGGPGQAPINNNNWSLKITGGGKQYFERKTPNGKNGSFDFTVKAADFGGTKDAHVTGQWNYGGNSWYRCDTNGAGGAIDKQKIDTGTVSTTTQHCTMTFDC